MQKNSSGSSPGETSLRYLSARGMSLHITHLKANVRYDPRNCGFCSDGVSKVVGVVEEETPRMEPEVVQGDRVHEKETTALSPDLPDWNAIRDGLYE